MACLALSLQPTKGPDILLKTREWFPPSRALAALASFRLTRRTFSSNLHGKHPILSEDLDSSLGDDPLAASSGQLIVGVESKYRIVYRLVNSVYVLAIGSVDLANVFDCAAVVNQAVSVVVVACRGIDVTPEKIHRKYAEVYMALDIVLHGISGIRLSYILSSLHGDGIAKMVQTHAGAEVRLRGADGWLAVEGAAASHQKNLSLFSNAFFELPPQTLAAGDDFAAALAPTLMGAGGAEMHDHMTQEEAVVDGAAEKDPFAASDALNNPEALVGGFKKRKDSSGQSDLSLELAGLDVTTLPPPSATQSIFIGVEGFEGEYGGLEFSNEETTLKEAFEGFDVAFGGGLDVSEFLGTTKVRKPQGLGGLEELQSGQQQQQHPAITNAGGGPLEESVLASKAPEMKGPQMYISEEINAEFRESLLARVGLQGTVYLITIPPCKQSGGKETEFSFRIDGTAGIKRAVMQGSRISSLGNGLFHIRTLPADEPIPILKYSLQPRHTPLPLRVRLLQRRSGTLLSVMIQYASNPELPAPLSNVTFLLKLPVDPSLLKVSPKAVLNREERELRWHVEEIPLKGRPGRLRARMPVDNSADQGTEEESELDVVGMVRFSVQSTSTLSGVSLGPVSDDKVDFYQLIHRYASGIYMCCQY